jgi:predicted ester cyclase
MNRLEHIRRMFEGKAEPGPFSKEYVSHTAWDHLAQHGAAGRPGSEKNLFRPEKVFTDMKVSLQDAFEDGDKVVVRWRLRGTWTQPIPGIKIKPTGRPVDLTGLNIYRFAGDEVVEKFGQFDVGAFHAEACAQATPEECVEALKAIESRT